MLTLADEIRGLPTLRPMRGTKRVVKNGISLDAEREAQRAYAREWAKNNPDKIAAIRARNREKHRAKRLEVSKRWRLQNLEHVRAYDAKSKRAWRKANPEKSLAAKMAWLNKPGNRERVNQRRRERYAEKKGQA